MGDPLNSPLQPLAFGCLGSSRFFWAGTDAAQLWHNDEQELSSSGRCLLEKYFLAENMPAGTDTVYISVGEAPDFGKGSCCSLFHIGIELGWHKGLEDIRQTAGFESCLHLLEETAKVSKLMKGRLGTLLR